MIQAPPAPAPLAVAQHELVEATRSFARALRTLPRTDPEFRRRFTRMAELRRRRDDLLARSLAGR